MSRRGPRLRGRRGGTRPEGRSGADDPSGAEAFAERARCFRSVLCDASSLIVLEAAGALDAALSAWDLLTIPGAAAEAGPAASRVRIVATKVVATKVAAAPLSVDAALVAEAAARGLPLLSEDKKVLMAADARGLDCFESRVALELLRALGRLDGRAYAASSAALDARLAPSPAREARARDVAAAAAKYFP